MENRAINGYTITGILARAFESRSAPDIVALKSEAARPYLENIRQYTQNDKYWTWAGQALAGQLKEPKQQPATTPAPAQLGDCKTCGVIPNCGHCEGDSAGPGTCPYCSDPLLVPEARNPLSRWLSDTYICESCGNFEAFVDAKRNNKPLAFTALVACIGVAVEGEPGYYPLAGDRGRLIPYQDAQAIARDLNQRQRVPIDNKEEFRIVATTMRSS